MDPFASLGRTTILRRLIERSPTYKNAPPARFTDKELEVLTKEGLLLHTSADPYEAQEQIVDLSHRVAMLPAKLKPSDKVLKVPSSDHLLYLDSAGAIRHALRRSKDNSLRKGYRWRFEERHTIDDVVGPSGAVLRDGRVYPNFSVHGAVEARKELDAMRQERGQTRQAPPLGFYWVDDNVARVVTWLRAFNGHDLFMDHVRKVSSIEPLHKEVIYGDQFRCKVPSSDPEKSYIVRLDRLPITKRNDPEQFVAWRRMHTYDETPDQAFRGGAKSRRHGRANPPVLFTSAAIAAYDFAVAYLRKFQKMGPEYQVWVNPFPMINPYTRKDQNLKGFLEKLSTQALIDGEGLNMTTMELLTGARVMNQTYGRNMLHLRRKRSA